MIAHCDDTSIAWIMESKVPTYLDHTRAVVVESEIT
jgi:hypothetical protein